MFGNGGGGLIFALVAAGGKKPAVTSQLAETYTSWPLRKVQHRSDSSCFLVLMSLNSPIAFHLACGHGHTSICD